MKWLREFLEYESAGGILIFVAAILALIMKNSFLGPMYDYFLTVPVSVQAGTFEIDKPLLLWINDGMMAVFFLLVGLEIKREILEGHLSTPDKIALPAIAALGGLMIPALIYSLINWGDPMAMRGWAIPAATDIAFALGVLALLGRRVPHTLKLCLLAIAIIDDLAAIVIIALFYTEQLSLLSIGLACLSIVILFVMNKRHVDHLGLYIAVGVVLWVCVLKSGVHATLAGAMLAFFIPLTKSAGTEVSLAHQLERVLFPWVAFFILPTFAFANAGVSLTGLSVADFTQPITLGITLGLLLGKQLGVILFTRLGVLCGFCRLPEGVNWRQYHGMALLTGIGFTMSLFIGTLAFSDVVYQNWVRLGVLTGSLLSGILGYTWLSLVCQQGSPNHQKKTSS